MNNITTYSEFVNEKFNPRKFMAGIGIIATTLLPLILSADEPIKISASASAGVSANIVNPVSASLKNDTVKTEDIHRLHSITRDGKNITVNYE